jgi:hypothetical protein
MDRKGYIAYISSGEIDYEEYLSEISKFPDRNYELGPTASRILLFFAMHPYLSTYQIFSSLRGNSGEMAYKNVHKIVKHLHSLKLIELVGKKSINEERESIHNPKYYRLTTGGIFSLINNYLGNPGVEFTKKFIQNYSENILFRTLLNPYFEDQSLSHFDKRTIFEQILGYLNKCCDITNACVDLIEKNDEFILMHFVNWDNPETPSMQYLNNQFNLNLTEKIRVEKIDVNETIKISDKTKSVFITLNEKKDAAILSTKDGKSYELGVELDNKNNLSIRLTTYREALQQLAHYINYNLLTLVFSINLRITEKDLLEDLLGVGDETKTNSFNILSKDRKFLSLLEGTKKLFDERYQEFIQLKNET